jgi:hypothetical protein|tara:strand:+ start:177 stop:425 length:249 start_codon:yes stop_codon:yes gene_type:complete
MVPQSELRREIAEQSGLRREIARQQDEIASSTAELQSCRAELARIGKVDAGPSEPDDASPLSSPSARDPTRLAQELHATLSP